MVSIKPFRGYRYNINKVKDLGLVITPPYDVLTKEDQDRYYKKSKYSIIRLILGKNGDRWYDEAAKTFKEWQKDGALLKDKEDCIYIYSQKYSVGGGEFTRTGFIALIELEELGKGVLPHEKTFDKPIEDRLNLMNTTHANLGQVFMIYDDRQLKIDSIILEKVKKKPSVEANDEYGISHRLWLLKEKSSIERIANEMKKYRVIIADGHHRYKTALKFREQHPELKEARYAMVAFINSFHSGLFIYPTHRLIYSIDEQELKTVIGKLKDNFEVKEVRNEHEMVSIVENTPIMIQKENNIKNHVFGMYHKKTKKSYMLRLKNTKVLDRYFPNSTDIYKKLDVTILHKLIIDEALGISEEEQGKLGKIDFVKGTENALRMMRENKKYQFGFFINPPLMREVFLTARANETMPRKSTYFYPKVYSGVVINKIEK